VTKALLKQEPFWNSRTVQDRLKERKLTFEKIATELSKIEGIAVEAKDLIEILNKKPAVGPYLLAAAKMDDDYKKNLLPSDFVDWNKASKCFGASICTNLDLSKTPNYETVDLPPFLKYVLIGIIQENRKQNFSEKT
jgi:hypothetical protein